MITLEQALGIISAVAVIVPGVVLLTLLKGLKVKSLRDLTIFLSFFAILHGFYHVSALLNQFDLAEYINLASAVMLIGIAMYYSEAIMGLSMFLLVIPDSNVAADLVPIALIIALILFARLAFKSKSLSTLQAQLSIFLIIWIISELLRSFQLLNIISASASLQLLGLEIHTVAMVAFGAFLLFRYYRVISSTGNIPPNWSKEAKKPASGEAK